MLDITHAVIAAMLLAAGGSPSAPDQKRADDLIGQGNELRRRGDNHGALEYFRQAHDLAPTPKTAAQLGLAEQATGRWADAEGHLTEALRDPKNPWVNKNRQILKDSLEDVHPRVSRLDIVGDPEGAEILVNGRAVGVLPLAAPIPVNAGSNDVEVRAEGFVSEKRSVVAPAQQVQGMVFRLARVSLPQAAPAVAEDQAGGESGLQLVDRSEPKERTNSRTWLWVGVGAAVVAAAVVGVLLITRKDVYPMASEEVSW